MDKRMIRLISFNVLIIFCLYIILSVTSLLFITPVATAASIEKDDVYTGIGLALLLMIISEIGQSRESAERNSKDVTFDRTEEDDIDLLARLIHAESQGEPYRGQVAVGAVVINRVKDAKFPDSIEKVIFQSGQFTVVENGRINSAPNAQAYKAAEDALDGEDPSRGALYFYNPKTARTLWWLSTRPKTVQIGNHVFAR